MLTRFLGCGTCSAGPSFGLLVAFEGPTGALARARPPTVACERGSGRGLAMQTFVQGTPLPLVLGLGQRVELRS